MDLHKVTESSILITNIISSDNGPFYDNVIGYEFDHQQEPSTNQCDSFTTNIEQNQLWEPDWADFLNPGVGPSNIYQYYQPHVENWNQVQVSPEPFQNQQGVLQEKDVEDFIKETYIDYPGEIQGVKVPPELQGEDLSKHNLVYVVGAKSPCFICYTKQKKGRDSGSKKIVMLDQKCDLCNIYFCRDCFISFHGPNNTFNTDYCPLCYQYVGKDLDTMAEHTRICEEVYRPEIYDESYKFTCFKCPYHIKMRYSMKTHLQVHLGDQNHQCPHCKRCFTHKTSLNRHVIIIHSKKKPS